MDICSHSRFTLYSKKSISIHFSFKCFFFILICFSKTEAGSPFQVSNTCISSFFTMYSICPETLHLIVYFAYVYFDCLINQLNIGFSSSRLYCLSCRNSIWTQEHILCDPNAFHTEYWAQSLLGTETLSKYRRLSIKRGTIFRKIFINLSYELCTSILIFKH